MRATSRLLAEIAKKPASQYLLAYAPTGLTGLLTHPFPRPTLISIYTQTLQKLAAFPSNSVYRTSVEALCKQRLGFITAQVPPGYAEWEQKVNAIMQSHPEIAKGRSVQVDGKTYLLPKEEEGNVDDRTMEAEWEGDEEVEDRGEGPRTAGERRYQAREIGEGRLVQEFERDIPKVPNEPPMTIEQITTLEGQFGAGLIEEVIAVAQAELELVDSMSEHQVWEELVEKAPEDQWNYFERVDRRTGTTQAPPSK